MQRYRFVLILKVSTLNSFLHDDQSILASLGWRGPETDFAAVHDGLHRAILKRFAGDQFMAWLPERR
jgi:hypothetical protein